MILKGVVEAYGWELPAYCLMRNHVHLVVQTPRANFGEGMQRLLGTYAQYFHLRHGESGHLFRRPFKSERIKDQRQFDTAVAYVAGNPVRAGLCDEDSDWRWSSHGTAPCPHRRALVGVTPLFSGDGMDPAFAAAGLT